MQVGNGRGPREGRRVLPSHGDIRQQLTWLAWLRLVVVTTALATAFLIDFVVKPDQFDLAAISTAPVYTLLLVAYAFSFANLAALALVRSNAWNAAIQFGGDLVMETAVFYLLVPVLGYDGAVAFALALYFLTTLVACAYVGRLQGALFATGGILLQAAAHALGYADVAMSHAAGANPFLVAGPAHVVRNVFLFMFTFSGTAWLASSRAERLKTMGARLQSVTDHFEELQAVHEHVLQSMSAALVTTDGGGRVTFANAAARRLLTPGFERLRGVTLHEALGWEAWREGDLKPLREGRTHRFARAAQVGGRRASFEVTACRLEGMDRPELGFLFLLDDVTELRALEAEIRLKEKMAAIGEMAAGIAHQIRNPLASISGSVQLLQRGLTPEAERTELMGIVLKESRRLDHTIRGFLEFARPRELQCRVVDVRELAHETLTLLRNSEEVGAAHVIESPSAGVVMADVDPDQFRQVLWNLCQNAIKAMPDGGKLAVSVEERGADVVLAVMDTGVGMSASARERAFQPLAGEFARGMGLGLAIVYRIVKDHGGTVRIDSEEGVGTRIEVAIPSARVAVFSEAREAG